MTPDTLDLIKALAAKFGVTIEYLWPLFVNYTRWINIAVLTVDVLWMIAIAIVWYNAIPLFFKHVHLYNHREDPEYVDYNINIAYMVGCVITVAVLGIVGLYASADMPNRLAGIMVPEAKAMLDLIAQVKR